LIASSAIGLRAENGFSKSFGNALIASARTSEFLSVKDSKRKS